MFVQEKYDYKVLIILIKCCWVVNVSSGNELHLYQRDSTAFLLDSKKASSCVGYIFELSKSFSEDDRDSLTNSNEKT